MRLNRLEDGAPGVECKCGGSGSSPRKLSDERQRPSSFPRANILMSERKNGFGFRVTQSCVEKQLSDARELSAHVLRLHVRRRRSQEHVSKRGLPRDTLPLPYRPFFTASLQPSSLRPCRVRGLQALVYNPLSDHGLTTRLSIRASAHPGYETGRALSLPWYKERTFCPSQGFKILAAYSHAINIQNLRRTLNSSVLPDDEQWRCAVSASTDVGRLLPGPAAPRVGSTIEVVFLIGYTQAYKWSKRLRVGRRVEVYHSSTSTEGNAGLNSIGLFLVGSYGEYGVRDSCRDSVSSAGRVLVAAQQIDGTLVVMGRVYRNIIRRYNVYNDFRWSPHRAAAVVRQKPIAALTIDKRGASGVGVGFVLGARKISPALNSSEAPDVLFARLVARGFLCRESRGRGVCVFGGVEGGLEKRGGGYLAQARATMFDHLREWNEMLLPFVYIGPRTNRCLLPCLTAVYCSTPPAVYGPLGPLHQAPRFSAQNCFAKQTAWSRSQFIRPLTPTRPSSGRSARDLPPRRLEQFAAYRMYTFRAGDVMRLQHNMFSLFCILALAVYLASYFGKQMNKARFPRYAIALQRYPRRESDLVGCCAVQIHLGKELEKFSVFHYLWRDWGSRREGRITPHRAGDTADERVRAPLSCLALAWNARRPAHEYERGSLPQTLALRRYGDTSVTISEYGAVPHNEGAGETGDPRENPLTNGIVRHDSHLRKSGDPARD
ncbi:hypothetical protein PR048_017286 [Dryococelus australis]|uniref:Uncharacterized protein n=1 Tax=Dryococelus australis TaxID=614101 RepID=A0ABQ9H933_9NEOP|nr:hypothetical protein PR048_017286 [Dryococelus australis]